MLRIATIVEGHGEVEALPILLRRIAAGVAPDQVLEFLPPLRVGKQKLLKAGELERTVEFAARRTGPGGRILIVLDADQDCPARLAPILLARACAARSDRSIRVVLPKAMFEAWFLAAARSIAGQRELSVDLAPPPDPEAVRDPKRWLGDRMPAGRAYSETLDQPALSAKIDLSEARRSPSFDKFWRDVESLISESGV